MYITAIIHIFIRSEDLFLLTNESHNEFVISISILLYYKLLKVCRSWQILTVVNNTVRTMHIYKLIHIIYELT